MNGLLASAALALAGILLFTRGFLLTRLELPAASACADAAHLPRHPSSTSPACWAPAHYDRLVLLIIDAWRYDFAAPAPPAACAAPHAPHCNRMPAIRRLLASRPAHARLYRAAADAPTVTMQRVKALATGGLPTFMDIGASFGSGRVGEDSWLAQAAASGGGGGLHLIGDDTWEALFPHVWTRAPSGAPLRHAPFSTFDTQDLDSGDARVAAELLPALAALARNDSGGGAPWRVLLAHAPGVDHVGHTHGAHHAAMARKLGEADALVAGAAAALARAPGRSLLVVAGDHGMTEGGNHGGASLQEAGAALLAVSFGRPLLAPGAVGVAAGAEAGAPPLEGAAVHDVSQLDLVPSIALALGLPIPYNSLGSAFADWEWGGARGAAHAALLVAFAQQRFMTAYSRAVEGSGSGSGREGGAGSALTLLARSIEARYGALLARYTAAEAAEAAEATLGNGTARGAFSEQRWEDLALALRALSSDVASACRAQWTQFSQGHMAAGLCCLVAALGFALAGGLAAALPPPLPPPPTPSQPLLPKELTPLPPSLLALALPALGTAACAARVWAQFTDTYITHEPALLLALQAVLVLALGGSASLALCRASPRPQRRAAAALPLALACLYGAAAAATAAPPLGWLHAGCLAHAGGAGGSGSSSGSSSGSGGSSHGSDTGSTPVPLALGAGAQPPILLPVDALDAHARSYYGASLAALLAAAATPLAAARALHPLLLLTGELGSGGGGAGAGAAAAAAAARIHAHLSALHARYAPVHCVTAAAAACVWLHWQGAGAAFASLDGGGWLPQGLLPPPSHAFSRAALLLTALAVLLQLCTPAPGAAAAAPSPAPPSAPPLLPLARLHSAAQRCALAQSSLLPACALLLGPWSPPVLVALAAQGACLVGLAASGSWASRALQLLRLPPRAAADAAAAPPCAALPPHLAALLLPPPSRLLPLLPPHALAAAAALFAAHAWGATGHTAQFSALAYNSGFLWSSAFSVRGAGALLGASTFGVSHGVLGGALLLWPLAAAVGYAGGGGGGGGGGGEGGARGARVLHVLVWGAQLGGVAGIAAMCALAQRHLMVWAVFAPKLVFDVAGLGAHAVGVAAVEALWWARER